jgi:hypothetical protein
VPEGPRNRRFGGTSKTSKIHWLVVELATPLKNDGVSNSWDDDIPNIWKKKQIFETTTH